ncbi:MAG: agmatine deiminase family protein [Gemmatimonadetes bacterium]|nr:agmatine deiminase family protein [Gemmatimonadota bacterium]
MRHAGVAKIWSILAVALAAAGTGPSAGAQDVPPHAVQPWHEEVAEIAARYRANPRDARFRRTLPTAAETLPRVIAANEADPVEGVVVVWRCKPGATGIDELDRIWMTIIRETIDTGAEAYVYLPAGPYDEAAQLATCGAKFESYTGISRTMVNWFQGYRFDAFWVRDFAPFFVREIASQDLLLEDALYYPQRPRDDAQPADLARRLDLPLSRMNLRIEGGNFLPNGGGLCVVGSVVLGQNPQYSEAEIKSILGAELGCRKTVIVESLRDFATGHVDVYLSWADRTTLLVGEYQAAQDRTNRAILERNVAQKLSGLTDPQTGQPIRIVRVPMPSNCPKGSARVAPDSCPGVSGRDRVWRTYLNVLMVNGKVLMPVFVQHSRHEAAAATVWAGRGFEVVPVRSDRLTSGQVHCITKSIDAPR